MACRRRASRRASSIEIVDAIKTRGGTQWPDTKFYSALGRMSRVSAQRGCRSADQKFRDSSAIDLDSETGAGRELDPAGLVRYRFSQNLHPHRMLGLIELE